MAYDKYPPQLKKKLFDSAIVGDPQSALEFISNILESSTEYSIIAKDLDGNIVLWNAGAQKIYGYGAEEVIGKMNASKLYAPEDVKAGLPQKIMSDALTNGKFEGTIARIRKNGDRFTSRFTLTVRRDAKGMPIGFLLINSLLVLQSRTNILFSQFNYATF